MRPGAEPAAPYITVIPQVQEVNLAGSADLAFWQEHLAATGLAPTPGPGGAQVLLSAPDLRWGGIRFQELSLTVVVSQLSGGAPADGLYLAHAYNSSRALALLERVLFHTPYERRPLHIRTTAPVSITVPHRASTRLHAAMAPSAPLLWSRDDGWEGPIFLPGRAGVRGRPRWFRAKVGGPTRAYRFDPSADTLVIRPTAGDRLLRLLADSQFTPVEWRLRTDATHARSRTYRSPAGQ